MASGPCLNPNCKSNGHPHPNCKCYSQGGDEGHGGSVDGHKYANGGRVGGTVCDRKEAHSKDCEYYAEGGLSDQKSLNPETPDQESPDSTTNPPSEEMIPFDKSVPLDEPSKNELIPFDQSVPLDAKDSEELIPFDKSVPLDADDSDSETSTLGAGLEGVAKGVAGPLATGAELALSAAGVPNLSAKDQAKREAEHAEVHQMGEVMGLLGSMFSGTGEAALALKAGELGAKAFGKLAIKAGVEHPQWARQLGSAAVKGFIDNSLIEGGDEISKAMLGKGDPEAPVSAALAHMGAAGLLGTLVSTPFEIGSMAGTKALKMAADAKLQTKAENLLQGMGIGAAARKANVPEEKLEDWVTNRLRSSGSELDYKDVKPGIDALTAGLSKGVEKATRAGTEATGSAIGGAIGGWGGVALGNAAARAVEGKISRLVEQAANSPLATKAVAKALSEGNISKLQNVAQYAGKVARGENIMGRGVRHLFDSTHQLPSQAVSSFVDQNARDKLEEFIDQGGLNQQIQNQTNIDNGQKIEEPQKFAEGGMAEQPLQNNNDHFGGALPEQLQGLLAAKTRIAGYLGQLKPNKNLPQLPFDAKHNDPTIQKSYNRALDIANKPLSILGHIAEGTLVPEHLQHFNAMYPELKNQLAKKMTDEMVKRQSKKDSKLPPAHVRLGMAQFLGTPLDSTMTPASIQAIQSTYTAQKAPPSPPEKGRNKKDTSTLSKLPGSYQTPDQNREARKNKS